MATAWQSKTMVYYAWLAAARLANFIKFILGYEVYDNIEDGYAIYD